MNISGYSADIWILGSSIIQRASDHVKLRPTGSHLGFDKSGFNVTWIGYGGLRWHSVEIIIWNLLAVAFPPKYLIIHCGGNDIPLIPNGDLIFQIKRYITNISLMLPNTTIIWSDIMPRSNWRFAIDNSAVDLTRIRINRAIRIFVQKLGGKVIMHRDFDDQHTSLFDSDGVHLSYIGNDIFINELQSALEMFISRPYRMTYPEEIVN